MAEAPLTPTAAEQELLELINATRADPAGTAAAMIADYAAGGSAFDSAIPYFGVDTDAFLAQMAAYESVPPLAWNGALAAAARAHSQVMIDTDSQTHRALDETGAPLEPELRDRVVAAGYEGWTALRENVFAHARSAGYTHAAFLIDWGTDAADLAGDGSLRGDWQSLGDGMQDGAGHRKAILAHETASGSVITEIGIGVLDVPAGQEIGPVAVTQDFGGRRGAVPQLLGVVLEDADGDGAYDAGEGLAGVTVTATGPGGATATTTSWSSGGYQMALGPGSWEVTFAGGGLAAPVTRGVTMAGVNVKADVFAGEETPPGPPGPSVIAGDGGADVLHGGPGDAVVLGDGFAAALAPGLAAQVYRLYGATLGREPDAAGLAGWTLRLVSGEADLGTAAAGFVGSREFQAAYGALDDAGFVSLLYGNVLGRAPDAGGLAGWVARMEGGTSRAEVVTGFSESAEYRAATDALAAARIAAQDPAGWVDDVFRLYGATLGRTPDGAGLAAWTAALAGGRGYSEVIAGFTGSREFQAAYGALDDAGFVSLLYGNVLGRAPDAGGLAGWVARMEGGTSRAGVVAGFAQSGEYVAATAAPLEAFLRGQGPDDTLSGGGGANRLAGGPWADVFVFAAGTAGTHTVLDFEPWDTLRLEGFGHASAAAARADLRAEGADTVFEAGDVSLTLLGIAPDFLDGARLEIA